jgi:hypothetical protein
MCAVTARQDQCQRAWRFLIWSGEIAIWQDGSANGFQRHGDNDGDVWWGQLAFFVVQSHHIYVDRWSIREQARTEEIRAQSYRRHP